MNATAKPPLRTRIRPYAGAPSDNAGEGIPPDQVPPGHAPRGPTVRCRKTTKPS
jgi:hypothetical protein